MWGDGSWLPSPPSFSGTLAGGLKISDWCRLVLFAVADFNYTVTDLNFTNEQMFTNAKAAAFVFSSRLGVRGKISEKLHLGLWAGTMFQHVSEFLIGSASDESFAFMVVQDPVAPWNALFGARLELGRHVDVLVEGGIGTRMSIMTGLTYRF